MRRVWLAVSITIIFADVAEAGVLLRPYEVARHKDRMVAAETLQDKLARAVDTGATSKARRAAKKLSRLLAKEEAYWERAGLPDALSLARHNREAAERALASAEAGDLVTIRAANEELRGSCVACHQTHPERRVLVEH